MFVKSLQLLLLGLIGVFGALAILNFAVIAMAKLFPYKQE